MPETATVTVTERAVEAIPVGITTEAEEEAPIELNEWVIGNGLREGEFLFELNDQETGQPVAVVDVAGPDGLQPGLSQPFAVLLDEDLGTIEAASLAGFKCFAESESFKNHVEREVFGGGASRRLSSRRCIWIHSDGDVTSMRIVWDSFGVLNHPVSRNMTRTG